MPQFYNGNPNLPSHHDKHQFTPEEIQEYVKCANDPEYFIKNYVKIIHVDKGLVPFEPYSYQKRIIDTAIAQRCVS